MSCKPDDEKKGNVLPFNKKGYAFNSYNHLTRNSEFESVFREHDFVTTHYFTVYKKKNIFAYTRIGIMVPRHIGNAPQRNRIKRLVRETFRLIQYDIHPAFDMIIIARKNCSRYTQQAVAQELVCTWKKSGII